jgi:hypothetical protein
MATSAHRGRHSKSFLCSFFTKKELHPSPVLIYFLGQSHLTAALQAWATAAPPDWQLAYLQEDSRTLSLAHIPTADVYVSMLGGNDHAVLAMLNHDRRFDVVMPGLAHDSVELVPAGLLRAEIGRRAAPHLAVLAAFRATVSGRMIHIESPPPIPSAAHIEQHPGVFAAEIAARGVAPARLRYKAWRLQSEVYRQACDRLGVEFLGAPASMQDAQGMMVPAGWNPDPTHGNAVYGAAVLRALAARIS